jgi:hypothetical protein
MTGAKTSSLLLALVLASGCAKEAGPGEAPRTPAPPQAWQGIYQGPYHIYLRLMADGELASGTWQAMGERTGEFAGEIEDGVLRFNWTEHFREESWSGRGYFVYGPARASGKSEIRGEWGLGARSTGGSWWAIKRDDLPLDTRAASLMDAGADEDGEDKELCIGGCGDAEMDDNP